MDELTRFARRLVEQLGTTEGVIVRSRFGMRGPGPDRKPPCAGVESVKIETCWSAGTREGILEKSRGAPSAAERLAQAPRIWRCGRGGRRHGADHLQIGGSLAPVRTVGQRGRFDTGT